MGDGWRGKVHQPSSLAVGPTQPPLQWVLDVPPMGMGHGVDNQPSPDAKIEHKWSNSSATPTVPVMAS